jgi:hypothetical protein
MNPLTLEGHLYTQHCGNAPAGFLPYIVPGHSGSHLHSAEYNPELIDV